MKKLKLLAAAVAAQAVFASSAFAATFMPVGVQNDVAYSTVTNTWGWDLLYTGNYSASGAVADIFQGVKTYVMIGAMRKGSSTIEVLAATTLADLYTVTSRNETHASNGAEWYFNNQSMGFAGLGDAIQQNSADINGSSWSGQAAERDRLSWHTSGSTLDPEYINGGWRAGSYVELNASNEWQRVIFTTDSLGPISAVPEPATWAMMIIGFGAVGTMVRSSRRRTMAAVA